MLDLTTSVALHQRLLQARGRSLRLDAGRVARISGIGLQLLLAAKAAWAADGVSLVIHNMSEDLSAGLAHLGVQPDLFADKEG